MGLAHLQQALEGAAAHPILHLSALNPLVASTLTQPGASFVPRQHAPCCGAAQAQPQMAAGVWGVSAFAFQGTNAHALLMLGGDASLPSQLLSNPGSAAWAWAKERYWIGPEVHSLVGRMALTARTAGAVLFEADLLQPKHAGLWDHQVAGRPILPGAAFLEAAAACLRTAVATSAASAANHQLQVLLSAVSIPAPLELPASTAGSTSGSSDRRLFLQCQVDLASGRVRLASATGTSSSGSGTHRDHLYGTSAAAAATQASDIALASAQHAQFSALLPLLLLAASLVSRHPQAPASIGAIESLQAGGRQGVDPACLDASFHLGALPPGSSRQRPQLRVPASIATYQAQGAGPSAAAGAQLLGGCQPVAASVQGAITNNYWLARSGSNCGCGSVTSVLGLEARLLSQPPTASSPAASGAESSSSHGEGILYEVAWLAAEAATSTSSAAALSGRFADVVFSSHQLVDWRQHQVAAAGIAALQQSGMSSAVLASSGMQEGASSAALSCPAPAAAAAMLQGILKAAAQEHPRGIYAAHDSDAYSISSSASTGLLLSGSAVAAAVLADVHGIALRSGMVLRPHLLPAASSPSKQLAQSAMPTRLNQGAVIVTGGSGTLGQLVASNLIAGNSSSSMHLFLLGRSGRLQGSMQEHSQLLLQAPASGNRATAAAVFFVSCDVATAEDAAAAVAAATSERHLAALLHAGGVLADALLGNQTASGLRLALAPKTASLACLDRPATLQPAALQLLFSSVAALLGSPGQANYSAANAALDAAAQRAQQAGLPSCSVQWGAWVGAGMAAQDRSTALRVQRMGMAMVDPSKGLAALARLVKSDVAPPLIAAVPFLPELLAAQQQQLQRGKAGSAASTLLSEIAGSAIAAAAPTAALPPSEAVLPAVLAVLRSIVGTDVSIGEPLLAAGLDSLGAVELKNSLESRLAVQLPSTLVFDYPTAESIADHISALQSARSAPGGPTAAAAATVSVAVHAESVASEVSRIVAGILGSTSLDPQQPLMAAGLDSLGAVELKNSLEAEMGLQLPGTLVFDYPTTAALGEYIASRLQPTSLPAVATTAGSPMDLVVPGSLHAEGAAAGRQPLALASMATRSPKAS